MSAEGEEPPEDWDQEDDICRNYHGGNDQRREALS
jgi:hypothetical protein